MHSRQTCKCSWLVYRLLLFLRARMAANNRFHFVFDARFAIMWQQVLWSQVSDPVTLREVTALCIVSLFQSDGTIVGLPYRQADRGRCP